MNKWIDSKKTAGIRTMFDVIRVYKKREEKIIPMTKEAKEWMEKMDKRRKV